MVVGSSTIHQVYKIDRAALCEASQERSRVKQKAQKVQKVTKKNYVKKILHEDKKKSCGSL